MRVLATIDQRVNLDLIDKKILYLLAINSRFSYSTIAKHVNLSREAVKQRINKLMEKKVVLGFQAMINGKLLGFSSYHVFLRLNKPQKKIEEELIKEISSDSEVNALLRYEGNFDFEVAYSLREISELDSKLKKLLSKDINNYIFCVLLNNFISQTYPTCLHNLNMVLKQIRHDGSFQSEFSQQSKNKKVDLDKTDYELISLLVEDARMSLTLISSKLNISIDSVSYRIKKLISSKIIIQFRPIINYAALGFSVYSLFFRWKNITPEKENKFRYFLEAHKHILWSTNCLGPFNNITYLIVKDTFEYHQIMGEIREKFYDIIETSESLLAFAEYKYLSFPTETLKKI